MRPGTYYRSEQHKATQRLKHLGQAPNEQQLEKMREKRKLRIGELAPTYGKKHTDEVKNRISNKLKNRIITLEHRKKISQSLKNKERTKEHCINISKAKKGCSSPMEGKTHSAETKDKIRLKNLGLKRGPRSLETRLKISEALKGEKAPNWQGGIYPENEKIRKSIKYRLWRESIFKKDDYTCQHCGQRGGKLQADHIKPFSRYPKMRFLKKNGRTLCIPCHKKTDTYGWKMNYFVKQS